MEDFEFSLEQFAEELTARAKEKEHIKFKLITSLAEYLYYKEARKFLLRVLREMYRTLKLDEYTYFKEVHGVSYKKWELNQRDPTLGGEFSLLSKIVTYYYSYKFYADEFDIIDDMLKEYRVYRLFSLNFFSEREEDELYDFRSKYRRFKYFLF